MEMKSPIRVLITGVSGGSIGEQVYKCLKSGRLQYRIIVSNVSGSSFSIVGADGYELLPHASSRSYIDSLLKVVDKHKIQFLIPGSEPELLVIARSIDKFTHIGAIPLINSPEVISKCIDKEKTFKILSSKEFDIPPSKVVKEIHELEEIKFGPPWVIKPISGSGGSTFVFIAQDNDELRFFSRYLLKHGHIPMIQSYIGRVDQEFTVGVLSDPGGKVLGTMVINRHITSGLSNKLRVKNHTENDDLGEILAISSGITQGCVVNNSRIKKIAESISRNLGSTGPMNIQGRLENDIFYPFEINPRFSGTSPIRTMAGFNEPEQLIQSYLGYSMTRPISIKYGQFSRGIVEFFDENDCSQCVGEQHF